MTIAVAASARAQNASGPQAGVRSADPRAFRAAGQGFAAARPRRHFAGADRQDRCNVQAGRRSTSTRRKPSPSTTPPTSPTSRSTVGVRNKTSQSIGSGLIISADGFVVTKRACGCARGEGEGGQHHAVIRLEVPRADRQRRRGRRPRAAQDRGQDGPVPYFDLSYTSPNLLGRKRSSRSAARPATEFRQPRHPQRVAPQLHGRGPHLQQTYPDRCCDQSRQQRRPSHRPQRRARRHQLRETGRQRDREHRLRRFRTTSSSPGVNDAIAVAKGLKPAAITPDEQQAGSAAQIPRPDGEDPLARRRRAVAPAE